MRVSIRLTPRAATDQIVGIENGALKVTVTAPPAESRANDALLRLLAREWRIAQRDLTITAGAKSRDKTILIRGDPAALMARLAPGVGGAADANNISVAPRRTMPILVK